MNKSNNLLFVVVAVLLVLVAVNAVPLLTGQKVSATGGVTGTTQLSVATATTISLDVNTVDFGSMQIGETNNTADDKPYPFVIQNDGTVKVNITINASDLFTGTHTFPGINYQYAVNTSTEGTCFNLAGSNTSWTYMPATASPAIGLLDFPNGCDTVQAEINVTVPSDESVGSKTSTVWFIATQG